MKENNLKYALILTIFQLKCLSNLIPRIVEIYLTLTSLYEKPECLKERLSLDDRYCYNFILF